MFGRIQFEQLLALDSPIDLQRWNNPFLHNSVSYDRRKRAVKEIEDPVLDTLQTRPEFVDTISQEIRLRTAEFVAKLTEPL